MPTLLSSLRLQRKPAPVPIEAIDGIWLCVVSQDILDGAMNQTLRFVTVTLAVASVFSGCATQGGYLLKQGRYLLSYSTGAVKIEHVIEDPQTDAGLRNFLTMVQDIRIFAVKDIGLTENANFTRYKVIDRTYLADVVQACDAVSFTPYLWKYPILGPLPYKGFYERADAEAEAQRLKDLGYDVIVRKVDTFSTLGFLKDPVYSFFSKYSPYDIAELIIHEQSHATLFLKGQSDFNEEFATFVGEEGALRWLVQRFGKDSTEYAAFCDEKADAADFLSHIGELKGELSVLYSSGLPKEEMLCKKTEVIGAFKERYARDYAPGYRTEEYRTFTDLPINNAYLSLYDLYSGDVPLLQSFFEEQCGSDLSLFVSRIKELASKGGDVKERIRSELGL